MEQIPARKILIVSADPGSVGHTVEVLASAGFEAMGATSFEDALHALSTNVPDLLIADQRLGAFNGLHLVLRGRVNAPHMHAIVTSPTEDRVLESDARQLNAHSMVRPNDPHDWLGSIHLDGPVH